MVECNVPKHHQHLSQNCVGCGADFLHTQKVQIKTVQDQLLLLSYYYD